jgi:uncharacterized membrane protein
VSDSAPPPTQAAAGRIAGALYLSGAVTVVVGIVLGVYVSPALFGIVVLGIVDFVIARLFASGRIGPLSGRRAATAAGDAAAIAEADPSFNPYARED